MAQRVQMHNPATGHVAFAFTGFSWTTLFFGAFPALFRGHFLAFLLMALANLLILPYFIFPFTYNRWHFNWLMKRGYVSAFALGGFGAGNLNTSANTNTVAPIINIHVAQPTLPGVAASPDQPRGA